MNNTLLCRYMNIVCKKVVHWYIERYATGYAQKWFATGYLSLVPPRTRLGQAWTLPWTVTSPERDSPTLSQTSHGQWVKRECLGTRLRISDTRLTSLRLVFWRIAPWGCLRGAIYRFSGFPVVHEIARKTIWQKATSEFQEPSLSNWGQVHILSCENEFCLNENEKSFPY